MYQSDSLFDEEERLFDEMELDEAPGEYLGTEDEVEMDVTLPPSMFDGDDSWTLDDFEDLLTGT